MLVDFDLCWEFMAKWKRGAWRSRFSHHFFAVCIRVRRFCVPRVGAGVWTPLPVLPFNRWVGLHLPIVRTNLRTWSSSPHQHFGHSLFVRCESLSLLLRLAIGNIYLAREYANASSRMLQLGMVVLRVLSFAESRAHHSLTVPSETITPRCIPIQWCSIASQLSSCLTPPHQGTSHPIPCR